MIGPYRVLHQIGSGVLGPVFRVLDPDADAIVAVKLFRFDWPPEQAHALAGALQTLIETLPAHPSIVAPLAAGLDGATPWLAQDLAAADGLDARMRRRAAVGAEALVAVLRQVASAIDAAAEAGWRHGALHPRDVLVDTTGRVRVTGIGIAQVVERFGAKPPRRRPYGAPERVAGQPWDVRADVFALGVIAAEWLAPRRGRPGAEPLAETLERAGFDGETAVRVLEAATAASPQDRPPGATIFVDALAAAIDAARLARTRTPAPGLLFEGDRAAGPPDASPDSPTLAGVDLRGPEVPRLHGEEELGLRVDDGALEAGDLAIRKGPEPALQDVDVPRPGAEIEVPAAEQPAPLAAVAPPLRAKADARASVDRAEEDVAPALEEPALDRPGEEGDKLAHPLDEPADLAGPPADPWGFSPVPASPGASRFMGSPWLLSLAAVLLAGLAIGFFLGRWSARPVTPPTTAAPSGAEVATPPTEVRDEPVLAEPPSGPAAGQPVPSPPAPLPGQASPAPPRVQAPAPRPVDGRVVVRSTPAGARVRMEGRDRGTTPLTIRGLEAGQYTLEISRQGYVDERRRVAITARQPSATVDVRLQAQRAAAPPPAPAATATLQLATRPSGAQVWLDGRQVGVTPLTLPGVAPGARSIRFELAGHAPWVSTVTLAAGESRRVSASLEPPR